jgi:DNA polymerase I-like protein with 3'-5' exonuclease and polymerase domains
MAPILMNGMQVLPLDHQEHELLKMNFYALDLETKSLDPEHPEYALQPWRVKERKAEISLIYTYWPEIKQKIHSSGMVCGWVPFISQGLDDQYVWTWNGIFDIAFLIASGVDCSKVKWLDAMSAFKWVIRSQFTDHPNGKRFSWSLANAAKHLLKDWPRYAEFLNVKEELLDDLDYWENRCRLDTEATLLIGKKCWAQLTEKQKRSFLIEQEALYSAALAWVNGCHYDMENASKLKQSIIDEQLNILFDLGQFADLHDSEIEKILASPKQLAELIFDAWKVPWSEEYRTDKGARSVGKPVLQFLIERHGEQFPQLRLIKQYRELKTQMDKFVKGPQKIAAYLGKNVFHHNIRLNSTYTGRCTYSSKVKHG